MARVTPIQVASADPSAAHKETAVDANPLINALSPRNIVDLRTQFGYSGRSGPDALWWATFSGAYELTRAILEEAGDQKQRLLEWTPTRVGLWKRSPLKFKARPIYGQAIHVAATVRTIHEEERCALLELLLLHRADPEAKAYSMDGTKECQPMHLAAGGGSIRCMELLKKAGASISAEARAFKDMHSKHVLQGKLKEADGDHRRCLQLLKDDPHINGDGYTYQYLPIHDAVYFDRVEAVHWLLDHMIAKDGTAAMNKGNIIGDSPLHIAAKGNQTRMVQVLLERGADHNCRDTKRLLTPLTSALLWGHREVAHVLLKKTMLHGRVDPDILAALLLKEGPGWVEVAEEVFSDPDILFEPWVTAGMGDMLKTDFWVWPGDARLISSVLAVPVQLHTDADEFVEYGGKEKLQRELERRQCYRWDILHRHSPPRVRAQVKVYPSQVTAQINSLDDLTDGQVIRAIAETNNREMLGTTLAKAAVSVAFDGTYELWLTRLDIVLGIAAVVSAVVSSSTQVPEGVHIAALVVLGLVHGKRTADELWQLISRIFEHGLRASLGVIVSRRSMLDYLNVSVGIIGTGFVALFFCAEVASTSLQSSLL